MQAAEKDLRARVVAALEAIFDPCSVVAGLPVDIVAMGLVDQLQIGADGAVALTLLPTSPACTLIASIMESAEQRLGAVAGVSSVQVSLKGAALWSEARMSERARAKLAERRQAYQTRVGPSLSKG